MWATLAFAVALTTVPAQAGPRLTNVRATYGLFGAPRADNSVLPGDIYFLTFEIENLTKKDNGEVIYRMGLELLGTNKEGKERVIYGEDPQEKKARLALGGNSLPAFAATEIPAGQAPGQYTVRITVVDPATKANIVEKYEFKVLQPAFGIVRVGMTFPGGDAAPTVLVPGQAVYVNCGIVGFERSKKEEKQPSLGLQMRILDEKDKDVSKPIDDMVPGKDRKVPEDYTIIPISLPLDLNRAGKFTIELQITDRLNTTTKAAVVRIPIRVVEK
jgi:hypothetical protein